MIKPRLPSAHFAGFFSPFVSMGGGVAAELLDLTVGTL